MAKNRELSQLGALVVVDDSNRNIGIATTATPSVGIGTTNPAYKLDVAGDINSRTEVRVGGVGVATGVFIQNNGTAAGIATVAAGVKKLNPYMQDIYKQEKQVNEQKLKVDDYKRGYGADSGMTKIAEDKLKSAEQMLENSKQVRYDYDLSPAAQKFQKLGSLKEPALLLGGTLAAVGTAAVAKKLFQKAEQERIKKEDPLQYKKYKRGDYTE